MTPVTGKKLETKRLSLRRFTIFDFSNMRKLESDAEIMKFIPSKVPQTIEQTKARLAALVENEKKNEPFGV